MQCLFSGEDLYQPTVTWQDHMMPTWGDHDKGFWKKQHTKTNRLTTSCWKCLSRHDAFFAICSLTLSLCPWKPGGSDQYKFFSPLNCDLTDSFLLNRRSRCTAEQNLVGVSHCLQTAGICCACGLPLIAPLFSHNSCAFLQIKKCNPSLSDGRGSGFSVQYLEWLL